MLQSKLQDGQVAHIQPILLTELYGWSCWRFNLAVQVQQQEQEVFYTIDVDPLGKRCVMPPQASYCVAAMELCTAPCLPKPPVATMPLTSSQYLTTVLHLQCFLCCILSIWVPLGCPAQKPILCCPALCV